MVCFCMFLGASWGFLGLLWGVLGQRPGQTNIKTLFMIIVCLLLLLPLLLLRRLRRLRRLCRRRRGRRRRLLLYHIPQRDEDRKHGDPGSEDPRSGRVGGCPEGLTIRTRNMFFLEMLRN